jgi:hypothetical protein
VTRFVAGSSRSEIGRRSEFPVPDASAVHTLHEDNPEAVLDALREFLGF